jgi:glycine oxidase
MGGRSNQFPANSEIIIIGGGVIGLSISRALALRGVREVMVIEKGEFGREASWAAGGILAPQVEADAADDFLKLACASRDLYPEFARALLNESAIDIELDTTGTLYVAFTEAEEKDFHARFDWQRSQGLSIEWLQGEEARGLEPALSESVRCALRFPNDHQVENRRLCEALAISNRKLGTRLVDHCEVQKVRVDGGKIRGVETSKGFIEASVVVIAAGAWSSSVDPTANLQVEPMRGQMLCFRTEPKLMRHVIYSSRGYVIPRRDGRLIAGSTSEQVGFDKRVTEEGRAAISTMAAEIAPLVATLRPIDSWAGFRPRASDGLPVLGISTDIEGLCYATGHYRNGILLAPITGDLVADAIISGATSPLIAPFSPNRSSGPGSVQQSTRECFDTTEPVA